MSQPCIQQTAVRVHQLADSEVGQLFLSLRFRCPKTRQWAYVQGGHQHYDVVLLSVFILAFFLLLEWTAPLMAPSPFTPSQPERSAPASTPFTAERGWRLIHKGQE